MLKLRGWTILTSPYFPNTGNVAIAPIAKAFAPSQKPIFESQAVYTERDLLEAVLGQLLSRLKIEAVLNTLNTDLLKTTDSQRNRLLLNEMFEFLTSSSRS